MEAGIILKAANNPNADTNDGTRGYALENNHAEVIKKYNTNDWEKDAKVLMRGREPLADKLKMDRKQRKLPIVISDDVIIELNSGPHNKIQKSIIDEFLPRFGYGAEVIVCWRHIQKRTFQK